FARHVIFKNTGKLPATQFVSVVKIEVGDAEWVTPELTDTALPGTTAGVIPIGAEVPQGSEGVTPNYVDKANIRGHKYLYVWGRTRFNDGFSSERHVDFCHRYPWVKATGGSISKEYARYHQYGNKAD